MAKSIIEGNRFVQEKSPKINQISVDKDQLDEETVEALEAKNKWARIRAIKEEYEKLLEKQ